MKGLRDRMVPTTEALEREYGIRDHPGYIGAFTTRQARGAYPNGSRVRKVKEDPGGDLTPLGSLGTVLGSLQHPVEPVLFYFVEWDCRQKLASGCVEWKIAAAE